MNLIELDEESQSNLWRGCTYEYSIQCLWIMCSSQRTGILHVAPQVPKLLETDFGDVDNVVRLVNRRFRIGASRYCRAEWHDEPGQVFVQCEQPQTRHRRSRVERRIRRHFLGVQLSNFVQIDGDAALVSSAGPLRILC